MLAIALALSAPLLLPPIHAAGPDDPSPFGIVCPWPKVGETGARWVRCGAGATQLGDWARIEPQAGQFTWDSADKELREWDQPEGLTPLPILAYTPPWASSGPDGDRAYPPRDLRHYARFVRETVARYRDEIEYWEIWNEPNIGFFKGTIPEYVDLLKAASVAAHQADPDAKIVFGGTAGVDVKFIERCYEHGAGPYFDVMAVHPYQWGRTFNDGWHRQKIERLRDLVERHDAPTKPIWLTEIGWSTAEISDQDQARLLVQSFVSSLGLHELGVAKAFWFSVKDWGGPGHGIFADDGSRKPAFEAYRTMTQELEGWVHRGRLDVGEVRCHLFGPPDDANDRLVFWSPTLEAMDFELPLPAGPLTLVDLYGTERQLEPGERVHLTATPEPSYLRLPLESSDHLISLLSEEAWVPSFYQYSPDHPAPEPTWASVRMPLGSGELWFVPGEKQSVTVDLWNLSRATRQAHLALRLAGETQGVSTEIPAFGAQPVSLDLAVSAEEEAGIVPMLVMLSTRGGPGSGPSTYELPVRIASGPTIEFLANSHLERSIYLQPDHKSGCSESCRFGKQWTYAFETPYSCDADLRLFLGAHQAGPFTVLSSQDGQHWDTLIEGRGDRAWRAASIDGLRPGRLYLRFQGENVQLEELVLTWKPR